MPETFEESKEVMHEVSRLRPQWIKATGERSLWHAHVRDWRPTGDFWKRVASNPDTVAAHLTGLGDAVALDAARKQSKRERSMATSSEWRFETFDFANAKAGFLRPVVGWNGDDIDVWRMEGLTVAAQSFGSPPFSDWLSDRLDLQVAGFPYGRDWVRFWLYGVESSNMPRWWLRSACQMLQRTRSTSPGTPADGQLATHMYECDAFMTCDGVFAQILQRCRKASPKHMGLPIHISVHDSRALSKRLLTIRAEVSGTK